jgi:quercetin dioxygenase-like cupin family protein
MRLSPCVALTAASLLLTSPLIHAETIEQLTSSGPSTSSIPLPDPTHIPIVFGKDIPWKGDPKGEQIAALFGAEDKPGIYGLLIKWNPGANSKPHSHSKPRYIYVVAGTWWVNSSTTYDKSKMYPVPAGSFVTDIPDTIHWDGAKQGDSACIILLVGEGPMVTTTYVQKDPNSPVFTPPSK